jgi:hypothetical protein
MAATGHLQELQSDMRRRLVAAGVMSPEGIPHPWHDWEGVFRDLEARGWMGPAPPANNEGKDDKKGNKKYDRTNN